MHILKKGILAAFIGSIISCSKGQEIPLALNNLSFNSNEIAPELINFIYEQANGFPNETQLSITIIKDSVPQFYGVKRGNDTLISVINQSSVFEIGSITKTFTATLLADQVVKGNLSLDDPIQNYLEVKMPIEEKITLKQLSNHTSGLPRLPSNMGFFQIRSNNPYEAYDQEKLYSYLFEKITLMHTPETKVEYSNSGAGLLGFTLTQKEGVSYNELLNKVCLLYTSPSPRDQRGSRMPSSA